MAALRPLLEELGDKHLLGEWELLDALEFFPELGGMDAAYARAEKLLTHESEPVSYTHLCLFDCITPAMLSRLLPDGALPGGAREELFRRTPLVRHDPARDRYYPCLLYTSRSR